MKLMIAAIVPMLAVLCLQHLSTANYAYAGPQEGAIGNPPVDGTQEAPPKNSSDSRHSSRLWRYVAWLLTAVLLALILNIASAYLKTPLDRLFARLSTTRNLRKEAEREKIQNLASLLADADTRPIIVAHRQSEILIRLLSCMCFLGVGAIFAVVFTTEIIDQHITLVSGSPVPAIYGTIVPIAGALCSICGLLFFLLFSNTQRLVCTFRSALAEATRMISEHRHSPAESPGETGPGQQEERDGSAMAP